MNRTLVLALGVTLSLSGCGSSDESDDPATDDLGFPLITRAQIAKVKPKATKAETFRVLGGRGDRGTRSDRTYDKLPNFDECFGYGLKGTGRDESIGGEVIGTDYTRWEFCFSDGRLVFKRREP